MVKRGGVTYPVAVEAAGVTDPELVIRSHGGLLAVDPELAAGGQGHLRSVARRSPGMHDGAVAVMEHLSDGVLHAGRSGYFAMIATCDALAAEAAGAASWEGSPPSQLPLRVRASELAGGDPLHNGAGRAAAIGVSVVLTGSSPAGDGFVIGRRRTHLAADPGRWHIAPSGMLEPEGSGEVLIRSVRRELYEELGLRLGEHPELSVLGFAHDLLRLRPEVCLRLDLGDWPGPPPPTEEFDAFAVVGTGGDALARFWTTHPPERITSPAAGAIALLEKSQAP